MTKHAHSSATPSTIATAQCDYDELSKQEKSELIRDVLPQCQPQEGSPPNTFTPSQLAELKDALPGFHCQSAFDQKIAQDRHTEQHTEQQDVDHVKPVEGSVGNSQDGSDHDRQNNKQVTITDSAFFEPDSSLPATQPGADEVLGWHGAPRFHREAQLARDFRSRVRSGAFTAPTNGVCPGFMQCNLVVLPEGKHAFDFLLFCQRNPRACPLVEVCDVGSPHPHGLAKGADLRTDVPKYAIYRDGKLVKEVTDATEDWPERSVAFLIGCSFSYDGALLDADIPLRSAEQGKNVPMYNTSLKCRSSGSLNGTMVVSMKPIPALKISKHIEITSKYTHAHGGPVCVGSAEAIGVKDIAKPEWGDAVDIRADEVPVFHACGVTPQSILMQSKVPFAITHSAGHMFVTDLPSDMGL